MAAGEGWWRHREGLTVYVTHRQLESRFRALRQNQEITLAGVPVRREPDPAEGFRPAGGTYTVGGVGGLRLLAGMDRLAALVGMVPVDGTPRDGDEL
jgi:hypothetical protein